MELNELKMAWADLDGRLALLESAKPLERRSIGVRAELRPLAIGQAVQAVIGVLLALAAGSFWVEHRANLHFLVTGVLLHLYGIAMVVSAVRNLLLVARVDEAAPVLQLQRRVAALRAWRVREGRWFGIVGSFMWVAFVVWGFARLGVDIVATAPGYVGFLLLSAFVCLGVFVVLGRTGGVPEGTSVRRARERLAEIRRFEDDA